jgi:hypothetical protein
VLSDDNNILSDNMLSVIFVLQQSDSATSYSSQGGSTATAFQRYSYSTRHDLC